MNQLSQPKKRPTGIVIIAVLWTLMGIVNIFLSLKITIDDLGYLSNLSNPYLNEWVRFGLPAELMLNFFNLAFGFLVLLVVYGLYTARSWSYHFGLAIPVFSVIISFAATALYASAPQELGFGEAVASGIPSLVWGVVWASLVWSYLRKPHVKQYLNVIPTPAPAPVPVPPPPEPVATTEGKKFCRYCGAENKSDAVFCEKCGNKTWQ